MLVARVCKGPQFLENQTTETNVTQRTKKVLPRVEKKKSLTEKVEQDVGMVPDLAADGEGL